MNDVKTIAIWCQHTTRAGQIDWGFDPETARASTTVSIPALTRKFSMTRAALMNGRRSRALVRISIFGAWLAVSARRLRRCGATKTRAN